MNTMKWTAGALVLGMTVLPVGAAWAADHHEHAGHEHAQHGHHDSAGGADQTPSISLKLPDTALTDQDGRRLRLVSDVVGDKIVVASFVYTSCTTICPVVSTLFSRVQDKLGGLLESRVRLVSLSVDPARDTPSRLKAYADQHGARPGWLWLTGAQADVTAALKGFGAYTANYQDHPVVIMIGDGRTGQWIRYYGFQDPERLAAQIRDVLAARGQRTLAAAGQD